MTHIPMGLTQRYIKTNLGHLRVQIVGNGPVMVFWPSLLMDGDMWWGQVRYFSDRYRLILVDPPGHGKSQLLKAHFSVDDCATCVVQILDHLRVQSCVFVGNSWGGMVGAVMAAQYPERVVAGILLNSTGSPAPWYQKIEFYFMSFIVRRFQQFPSLVRKRAVAAFIGKTSECEQPRVVDFIESKLQELNTSSTIWAVESVVPMRQDLSKKLSRIQAPMLVIAGEEDRTFSNAESRKMAADIPGARFEIFSKVGHLSALEAPNKVNTFIDTFLNGINSSKVRFPSERQCSSATSLLVD